MAWPATSTTTANLNLRQSPTMSSSVLTVMPSGGAVTITGAPQNGWYPVTYNGQTGWASATYINPPAPSSGGGSGSTTYGTSTTNTPGTTLNLRSGPGTGSSVIGSIPHGANLVISGAAQNGWYPVTYNGKTGYVSAQYVNPFTPSAPTTPTPDPGTGPTPPQPPVAQPPSVPAGQPQNPLYDPGSTYGGTQNWYNTPLVTQAQDMDSEWEKLVTDQGYGGFNTKANIARGLVDRAKSGFSAATMNNPNLTPRNYLASLGPNFIRNTMAQMSPMQRGEMPGIYSPRARWNER